MARRGRRSKEANDRRKRRPLTKYDQDTGEVINIQPRYIKFEIVPDNLGFLNVDTSSFDEIGMAFLHLGEVLSNWRGDGTSQVHPEMFDFRRR